MAAIPRQQILNRLKAQAEADKPIIGTGAGSGILAKFEEAGGTNPFRLMSVFHKQIKKDLLVICHGGPFDEPETVSEALLKMPVIVGLYRASSAERLPTERAITAQTGAFKALKLV